MADTGIALIAAPQAEVLPRIYQALEGAQVEYTQVTHGPLLQVYIELSGAPARLRALVQRLRRIPGVQKVERYKPFRQIYGKRVIVIGGGAQVSQVVLGAVSEADRHNLRGEMISVDTIPLVGEENLAEAVRAVARLHRAAILILAGSIMGGDVTQAVRHLRRRHRIPVISLNMAGGVPREADLVVTDPVQAGVMAVMAIADTAKFDIRKTKKRVF